MKPIRRSRRRGQSGAFLLEALIAILIISFGILGIVGLQAQSLRQVNDSQFRAEAAYYANSVAGKMWMFKPDANGDGIKAYFGTSGAGFTAFSDQITADVTGLPNAASKPPTITFDDTAVNSFNGVVATITINWQYPGETDWHSYSTQAVIGGNRG